MRDRRRRAVGPGTAALALAVALGIAGCAPASEPAPAGAPAPAADPAPPAGAAPPGTALAALAGLEVAGRAPRTGYDRDAFGPAWADVDRNGCSTRDDVLRRDLTEVVVRPGTQGCVVVEGVLADPYTGRTITFTKAEADRVQVDHVVALADAWQKGAQAWSAERRLAFANDPLNLLAVDGDANQAKGSADAASWLPPNRSYRCPMVARQVAVKAAYGLRVTAAERDALARVLGACPGEPLPAAAGAPPPDGPGTASAPAPRPVPAPPVATAPPAPAAPGADPRFPSCRVALAAGFGPYRQGVDPEYGWYTDGDGDGVVCE